MRVKTFFIVVSCGIVAFFSLIALKSRETPSLKSLVSETHKQIYNLRSLKDKLKNAEAKILQAEEKHLVLLGFNDHPRLYPRNRWTNTTLPVIVTSLFDGDEKTGIVFAKKATQKAIHHAVLMYNIGLSPSEVNSIASFCNTSLCQIVPFDITVFPSHIQDDPLRTVKPLIIQDALNKAGGVLYLDIKYCLENSIEPLIKIKPIGSFVTKQAVTTLTHPNMMTYFKTDVESFLFLPMVETNRLILWNTIQIHQQVMLPWIQCILTPECVHPIGAQSQGCRFDKKPQYRYSGCHLYDTSAFNVVLGLAFRFDETNYTFPMEDTFFTLSKVENETIC